MSEFDAKELEEDEKERKRNEMLENRHRGKGNISCLSCQPPNCEIVTICEKAVRCFTSNVRDADGFEHKSKGCVKDFKHVMFHCATTSFDGEAVHAKNNRSAQYAFDCCNTHMCNENNTFPVLPPVPKLGKNFVYIFKNLPIKYVLTTM